MADQEGRTRRVFYGSALTGLPPGFLVEDMSPDASDRFWQAMIDSVGADPMTDEDWAETES